LNRALTERDGIVVDGQVGNGDLPTDTEKKATRRGIGDHDLGGLTGPANGQVRGLVDGKAIAPRVLVPHQVGARLEHDFHGRIRCFRGGHGRANRRANRRARWRLAIRHRAIVADVKRAAAIRRRGRSAERVMGAEEQNQRVCCATDHQDSCYLCRWNCPGAESCKGTRVCAAEQAGQAAGGLRQTITRNEDVVEVQLAQAAHQQQAEGVPLHIAK